MKILVLIFILFLFFPKPTFAQETIKNFDTILTAHQDGTMSLEESITYDFGVSWRHGIFRFIPLVSEVGDLFRVIEIDFNEVKRNDSPEKYEVEKQARVTEIKIGDPDKTINETHKYTISYLVKNGIGSNYEDHDEIYWNVTGNQWSVPIEDASIILKADFGILPKETICFTGPKSSREQSCVVEDIEGGKKITLTKLLNPQEGLTIVSSFPVGTFPKSTLVKNPPVVDPDFINFLWIYAPFWLGLNFLLAPYLLYWYFKNRSKVRFGPPTVNFDLPKDKKNKPIAPAEIGIIDNTVLERDDVVATIYDLAIRKFIKIEEIKEIKTLRPDKFDFQFKKLEEFDGENEFEKTLMDELFKDSNEVMLKDLKKDFYKTFVSFEKEVFQSLINKGFYTKNPKNQKMGLLISGLITLFFGNIFLGPILIFLSRVLNGKTFEGDKMDWQTDGLKIFLGSVERYHKFQTKNLITVEKYIPYAISLGLQEEFMKELKIIYPDYKPTWYEGSHTFYNVYPSMYTNLSSNITSTAASSSSGFSGGSSGGGGGGGGGGSW